MTGKPWATSRHLKHVDVLTWRVGRKVHSIFVVDPQLYFWVTAESWEWNGRFYYRAVNDARGRYEAVWVPA